MGLPVPAAAAVFAGSLALSIVSSIVLAASVERIGARLGLAEGLQGIVTALAADAPEIASAVAALATGRHDLGVGVIFGSGVFNLAALLGLSAVIAGRIKIGARGLLFNGIPALAMVIIGAALATRLAGPVLSITLIAVIMVPYVLLSALHPPARPRAARTLEHEPARRHGPLEAGHAPGDASGPAALPFAARARTVLRHMIADSAVAARRDKMPRQASWDQMLAVIPALTAVVLASIGMVTTAEELGHRWGVSSVIVGAIVIAGLTGLPNLMASARLAVRGRGQAVVSEALNSNTLNIVAGAAIPALLVPLVTRTGPAALEAWWLTGMTVLVLGLGLRRRGISRAEGASAVIVYLTFAAVLVVMVS